MRLLNRIIQKVMFEKVKCERCGCDLLRSKRALLAPEVRERFPILCSDCVTPEEEEEINEAIFNEISERGFP